MIGTSAPVGASGDALEAMVARIGVDRGTKLLHGTIAASELTATKAAQMMFVPHPPTMAR